MRTELHARLHGCGASVSGIVLVDPPALSCEVTVDQESTTGDNGALTVTATGGTGEYTYLWSNDATTTTISGLGDGVYTVTVTDENGCTTVCSNQLTKLVTTLNKEMKFFKGRDVGDLKKKGIYTNTELPKIYRKFVVGYVAVFGAIYGFYQ